MDAKNKIEIIKKVLPAFKEHLKCCALCPRSCRADRAKYPDKGFCRSGVNAKVYSYFDHHGEEPALSGTKGSGTIFFSSCTMRCVYCQNHKFSQSGEGDDVTADTLAEIMLRLQVKGCHNINLVTPTHFLPWIIEALLTALQGGLRIPIVYNVSGYESVDILKLLNGVIDIYLPDIRYADDNWAKRYSAAPDYTRFNKAAIREMFDQAGCLALDKDNIGVKGLIIRHLVLPGGLDQTEKIFKFIAGISKDIHISLMSQYYPAYRAKDFPGINRRLTGDEYEEAADLLNKYGLSNGWVQEPSEEMPLRLAGTNIKKGGKA